MSTQKSIENPLGLFTVAHNKKESEDYIRGAADQFDLDERKVKELIQSERERAEEEKREEEHATLTWVDIILGYKNPVEVRRLVKEKLADIEALTNPQDK